MNYDLKEISSQASLCMEKLLENSMLRAGEIVVVGCSTSEIIGEKIGTASNEEVAKALFAALYAPCKREGVYLAVQCCEHLNRALVVERECAQKYMLEEVNVIPARKAGGALSGAAMEGLDDPVVVEFIKAHAGIDIGDTLIGMHLKCVVVPLRMEPKRIGCANVVMAKTRRKYIGGPRAQYDTCQ